MLFRSSVALLALSAFTAASPTPPQQLVLGKALDFAGKVSRIGAQSGGDVEAMTQWGWYDCGQFVRTILDPLQSIRGACSDCEWGDNEEWGETRTFPSQGTAETAY
jgi:hypothetical protein